MRLAVIGSETFTNYTQMVRYLSAKDGLEVIITGDAKGADQLAKQYAYEKNIPLKSFAYDMKAIIDNCDAVMAFWDGKSEGTQKLLRLAKRCKKKLEVIFLEKKDHESAFGYITF